MFTASNLVAALALGMLFGAVAGVVGAFVLSGGRGRRAHELDRERLRRAWRASLEVTHAGTPYRAETAARGLELRVASTIPVGVIAGDVYVDPPYSAAGGSFAAPRPPALTLVDSKGATP